MPEALIQGIEPNGLSEYERGVINSLNTRGKEKTNVP